MTPQRRALLYITRRKKTACIITLLLFALSLLLLLGGNLSGGIRQAQTELRKTFSSGFKVTMSSLAAAYMENIGPLVEGGAVSVYTGEPLDIETIQRIADCEGIVSYTAEYNAGFCSDDIIPVPGLHYNRLHDPERRPDDPDELARYEAYTKWLFYWSSANSAYEEEFRFGQFELVEGRHLNPDDMHAILISDTVAEQSGLTVGDMVHVYSDGTIFGNQQNLQSYYNKAYDLTIAGIYHVNAQQKIGPYDTEPNIAENKIFVDWHTVQEYVTQAGSVHNFLSATFFVDDPAEIDNIIAAERARDDIEWDFFDISVDESAYARVAEPLRTMQTALTAIMVILSCVILLLLYLVLRMALQSRKWEVKIYRSLGLSKRNILAQLFTEGVLMVCLAFALSAALSPQCTDALGQVAETMLVVENTEPREYTDAEMMQAIQNGTLQDVVEEQTRLYTEQPITVELQFAFSPAATAVVLVGGLLCVLGMIAWQSRELLNARLR